MCNDVIDTELVMEELEWILSQSEFDYYFDLNCSDSPAELRSFVGNETYRKLYLRNNNTKDLFNDIQRVKKDVILLPINRYKHSEVKYFCSHSIGWDNGVVGFAKIDKAKAREWLGVSRITKKRYEEIWNKLDEELERITDLVN